MKYCLSMKYFNHFQRFLLRKEGSLSVCDVISYLIKLKTVHRYKTF